MSAPIITPTTTPDHLVRQWSRKLHGLAYETGIDYDDVRQEAWLIAAEKIAANGDVDVGDWLGAVETQVLVQRDGVSRHPSARKKKGEVYIGSAWLMGSGDDDPCAEMQAAQTVALRVGGETGGDTERWQRIRQEIEMPVEPWEIAAERQVSARQGRRDAAKIREAAKVQRDLFSHDESGVTE